jgi:hypothetical protein
MPQKHKRPRNRKMKGPPRNNRGKTRQRRKNNNGGRRGSRPTLVLKAHALISQSITAVNIKQINIAPTASIFPADIL